MRIAMLLLGAALFAPDGVTLSMGCDGQPVPTLARTPLNTVEHALQAQISDQGLRYLTSHAEDLIGLVMPISPNGWVELAIPDIDAGNDETGVALSGLVVSFNAREVDLDIQLLSAPTRLHIIAQRVRMRVERGVVRVSLGGDIACHLRNDAETGLLIDADFVLDLHLALDDQAQLQARLEMLPFHVEHLGFDLEAAQEEPECLDSPEACDSMCATGDSTVHIIEGVYAALSERLNEMLRPLVDDAFADFMAGFLDKPLMIGARVHPRIMEALIPTAADAHPFDILVQPAREGFEILGGDGQAPGEAMALSLDLGAETFDHPCVPPNQAPPLFTPGPPPSLTAAHATAHLGLALSDAAINRALWVLYRSGTLCLALDSDQLQALSGVRFDTAALSLILPGLTQLADSPRPILITLDPRFTAETALRVRFSSMEPTAGLPQLGVTVSVADLGFSIYARLEERWTRLLSGAVEARLTGAVQALPNNLLHLTLEPPEVVGVEAEYNELLGGAHIPELLALVTDLASTALISDQMSFELPLDATLASLNLPFQADITALAADGLNGDYLSALLDLRRGGVMKLRARVSTQARALSFDPIEGIARVAVSARGADDPRYQWRLPGGPWRPLRRAEDGTLTIKEPRFCALTPQRLQIRAVDSDDYKSLDTEGVEIDPTAIDLEAPIGAPAAMSCAVSGPRPAPGPWAALLLLPLLALMRRRAAPVQIIAVALAALALGGCDDRKTIPKEVACQASTDCAGDMLCVDGACRAAQRCATSAECCPRAECQAGQCVPLASACHDDESCHDALQACVEGLCVQRACVDDRACSPGRCLGGYCQRATPCQQRCAADEACLPDLNVCRPVSCDLSCDEGHTRIVQQGADDTALSCDLSPSTCTCVANPPLIPDDFGRYADLQIDEQGQALFAAYDSSYGDLVLVEGVSLLGDEAPLTVTYLDGAPAAPVVYDPKGPRGGVIAPGEDRGRWARLKRDALGQLHLAYYDRDGAALRYLKRSVEGAWGASEIVDQEGDAGRYVRLLVDDQGDPSFVYFFQTQHEAGVRYAIRDGAGFKTLRVSTRPVTEALPAPGLTPKAHGVMPCARLGEDGRLWLAFYDSVERGLYLARGDDRGFEVEPMRAEPTWAAEPDGRYADWAHHDLGQYCDLEPLGAEVEIAFVDQTTQAILLYRGGLSSGQVERVVEGGGGIRRFIGADMALARQNQALVMAFQDSTDNDLWVSIRRAGGAWDHQHPFASAGALGFYNSLALNPRSGELVIGTLEMATSETGRSLGRLWAFSLPAL
ncbi:hypothetical protein KKF91_09720 [Myxococcota bacterium]|nr:hypothetical protein [Myxococcota bacterium]